MKAWSKQRLSTAATGKAVGACANRGCRDPWPTGRRITIASRPETQRLVDQNKIGLGLSVFVSVESDDHSGTWLKKFAAVVSAMPEVLEFYRMAGDVDYVLRVVVADMHSYDQFYKRLIGSIALKNVTSRFAMEKIKSVTALPVSALAVA
ncbi:Lrp/AsnC family transcriptional regulator [Bradyrhizobium viridifuturi]|uniref:Lrp/AsnC family transcriptional regulator n=1 Tax=Bradyrhizobium viridifuturi TaxID=1654716 RepID=UPI003D313597